MAQAWESDAIKKAGEKWAQAKANNDPDGMRAAAEEANRLREQAGYSLDGSKANADVTVKNQTTWRSSGSEKNYLAGAHGIGDAKSISQEQYNSLYGGTKSGVNTQTPKPQENAPKPTTTAQNTVQNTAQKGTIPTGAVARTVYKADGTQVQGYIKNGATYYMDGTPIQNGDAVIDTNGKKWVKGDTAQNAQAKAELDAQRAGVTQESLIPVAPQVQQGLPTTWEELMALVDANSKRKTQELTDMYEKALASQKAQIEFNTQQAIRDQEKSLTDAEAQAYELKKQAHIGWLKNQANLALNSAAKGDAGGIGQKQYSDANNSYDQQRYAIDLELANMRNQVAQRVADLEAQGRFDEAQITYEIGMKQIEAMQAERDNLLKQTIDLSQSAMDYQTRQDEIAFDRALQRLKLGAFSIDDAKALGVSDADAVRITQMLNVQAQIDLAEAEKTLAALKAQKQSQAKTPDPEEDKPKAPESINMENVNATKAQRYAERLVAQFGASGDSSQSHQNFIAALNEALSNGYITEDEAVYIARLLGVA